LDATTTDHWVASNSSQLDAWRVAHDIVFSLFLH
jgi:hypothetical protein